MSLTAVARTAGRGTEVFRLGAFDVHDYGIRIPLHGELDLASASELTAGLALLGDTTSGIVAFRPKGTVQLEMSVLTFLDSSGLTALGDGRDTLSQAGWRVCLTRPRPAALRLLNLAVTAGWFPAESACADGEFWRQVSSTRMTMTPGQQSPAAQGPAVAT